MPAMLSRKTILTGAKVLLSIVLLLLVIRTCDWQTLREVWVQANISYWAGYCVFMALYAVLGWWSLLVLIELPPGSRDWVTGLSHYVSIQFVSVFTPGRVAELSLPFTIQSEVERRGEIAAAILSQRISTILIVSIFAVSTGTRWLSVQERLIIVLALVIVGLVITTAFSIRRLREFVNSHVERYSRFRIPGFYASLRRTWLERPGKLGAHLIMAICRFLVHCGSGYFVVCSFDLNIPIVGWISLMSVVSLTYLFPITIWGLGLTEGLVVLGFQAWHIDAEYAVVVCIVSRFLMLLTLGLWSGVYVVATTRFHQVES